MQLLDASGTTNVTTLPQAGDGPLAGVLLEVERTQEPKFAPGSCELNRKSPGPQGQEEEEPNRRVRRRENLVFSRFSPKFSPETARRDANERRIVWPECFLRTSAQGTG